MVSLAALYVDFNSYFASVEQLLQPKLRGRPVGVLPVMAETTCCIAASYEAKAYGVKTGTLVREARKLCPDIVFVEARPAEYIRMHHRLVAVVESCTHVEKTLSIDEMVCMLTGSQQQRENALALAQRIKRRIAEDVGEQVRCSIGIGPNTFLAKVASDMQKPDGCVMIEPHELPDKLYTLELRDLSGIGPRMEQRLNRYGIESVRALYAANRQQLRTAWGSVEGERMYDKLRGWQPPERVMPRRTLGHSHVLPPELRTPVSALAVLHRLLQKACLRLRSYGLHASAISLRVKFKNRESWETMRVCAPTDDTLQLIHSMEALWQDYPADADQPHAVGVCLSGLGEPHHQALSLFDAEQNRQPTRLNATLDKLNMRYGKHTVYFGGAHKAIGKAPMRIAFNHIPDMQVEGDPSEFRLSI